MGTKKWVAGAAGVVAGILALSACTPTPTASQSASNTEKVATVAWNQPFYSYNNNSNGGNNVTNGNVYYITNDGFNFYDKDLKLQPNKSFGSYEKLSDAPLTIKLTFADTATWSDGVPVTPADSILTWGAMSQLFNTEKEAPEEIKPNTGKTVYFDAGTPSFGLIKEFPKIEGKSMTYTYSKPYADWEPALLSPGLPAHIVGKRALGINDPTEAANAVVKAFQDKDNTALSKISNVWNLDFNYTNMPADKDLTVSSGPYVITDLKDKEYITVTKNPKYQGEHKPNIDKVTIRFIGDALGQVQALRNGEVLVINPQSTADTLKAAQAVPNATVKQSIEASYEHIDLTFNNRGPFDPKAYGGDANKAKLVRQAFLHTIPRQKVIDSLIKPLDPNAQIRQSYTQVPGSPMYDAIVAGNGMSQYAGDIDKAKALLKEAGVSSPTVRIMYAADNPRRAQEFQLYKEAAESAGFKIVDKMEATWSDKLSDKTYDAVFFAFSSTSTAVTGDEAIYRTAKGNNYSGYSNATVDKLFDDLSVTTDPAKQQEILAQIEKVLVDDAYGLSIFQFPGITGISNKITGIDPITISPLYFWNIWEWKLA